MAEEQFKAITTQEEFDTAIKSRLDRQEKTIRLQYADYETLKEAGAKFEAERQDWKKKDQEYNDKISGLNAELETTKAALKDAGIKNLKNKIAGEMGLPAKLCDRLTGTTEDEIRKDAESLKSIFDQMNREGLPGFTGEKSVGNSKDAALRDLLQNIKKD